MGYLSASCALSGIELSANTDVFAGAMIRNEIDPLKWTFIVPPYRGLYDNYLGIKLLEDAPIIKLQKGETWCLQTRPDNSFPVFFNAKLIESLDKLVPDYTPPGLNNLKEFREFYISRLTETYDNLLKLNKELSNSNKQDQRIVNLEIEHLLNKTFPSPEALPIANTKSFFDHQARNNLDISHFLVLFGRAYTILNAAEELRKNITPGVFGPQDGGGSTLRSFLQTCIDIIDEKESIRLLR